MWILIDFVIGLLIMYVFGYIGCRIEGHYKNECDGCPREKEKICTYGDCADVETTNSIRKRKTNMTTSEIKNIKEAERKNTIEWVAIALADITDCDHCPIGYLCDELVVPPCHETWESYLTDKVRELSKIETEEE